MPDPARPAASAAVQRLREICLSLAEAHERVSHGEAAFFCGGDAHNGGKQFVMVDDHHHGEPRLAFWCAAAPGAQEELIAADPSRFFRPPYVGHRGWVGVRLDDVGGGAPDWGEIAEIVRDGYRQVAPRRLADQV